MTIWPNLGVRWITLATFGLLGVAWFVSTESGAISELFLPSPGLLWWALVDLVETGYRGRSIFEHASLSLVRVLLGFTTGAIVGTLLGLAMGYSRRVQEFFNPLIEFFRPLPQLAYLVLLIVWFGIGEQAQIILLFLTALPITSVAAMDGVRSVSVQRVQAARSLGANDWQIFRFVILPSALPEIASGARLAIGVVYAALVAAEMIGGSSGLGWMILDAGRFLRSEYVFVGILILGTLGVALDGLILTVERRVVHWAGRD